jgi:hypothetical protein
MRRNDQVTITAPAPAPARHRHQRAPGRGGPGRAFWRPGALFGLAGLIVGAVLFSAGAAFAYFVSTNTNSSDPAQAAATTLASPGAGQQKGKDQAGAVAISWTAPSGYTPTYYVVSRCAGTSCTSFQAIGNGSCSGTLHKTSCTDNDSTLQVGTTYSYEVTADLDNWVSPPNSPFQGTTAGATTLSFTTQPDSGAQIQAAGTSTFNVSVTIEDANGTADTTDSTDTVTLAIDSNHNSAGGTLTCNGGLTAGALKGVVSFKKCAIDKVGTYQLTATSSTDSALAAPANANSFSIIAGSPSQFANPTGANQTADTSAAFADPLTVTVEDVNGNPVPKAAVTFSAPANGASATFGSDSGCTPNQSGTSCVDLTNGSGVATSATFTASTKGGSYKITASSPGAGQLTFPETNQPDTSISSVVEPNVGGTAGLIGAGDTITVTFSGPIDPSTVCSAWTSGVLPSASVGSVVTVSSDVTNGDDVLKFSQGPTACGTFRFGTIDLGSSQYYVPPAKGGNLTFSASTIAYLPATHSLQIVLGTMTNPGTLNAVQASSLTLSLSTGILDAGDNPLTGGYTYTSPTSGVQF